LLIRHSKYSDLGPKEAQVLITMLSHLTPHLSDEKEVRFVAHPVS